MSTVSRKAANRLIDKIDKLQAELKQVQSTCDHATSVYKPDGSTGNWDREDSYWYECYCYDCQKRWTVDQDNKSPCRLKVTRVNVFESPEKIALLIRAEEVR